MSQLAAQINYEAGDTLHLNASEKPLRILVLSTPYPSAVDPGRGVFVKQRVSAMAELAGIEIRVIAPTPWFPPIKRFARWYQFSKYPLREVVDSIEVRRPKYFLPPKIGGYFHPRFMFPAVRRAADRLRQEFKFDVIDAHFVYPNGVVGAMLEKRYGIPVVMTGRGEDMLCFPNYPIKGKSIRWALKRGAAFLANSREIADAMQANGAEPSRITVIPNGVDTAKFHPLSQIECRNKLALPLNARMIVAVGDRLELKGFHILVDALPTVLQSHPDTFLMILGGPGRHGRDFSDAIEQRIQRHGLNERVRLVGPRPHDELPLWYNSADLFALLSSREGSPNVLLEALSCGLPAVATAVGGIADELGDPKMGILVRERAETATARAVTEALSRQWDRAAIRRAIEPRTWSAAARSAASEIIRARVQPVATQG